MSQKNIFDNLDDNGLNLLKKGHKGLLRLVFSRLGLVAVLLILQVLVQFSLFRWFNSLVPHFYIFTVVFTVGMILYLLNSRIDPTAKITWLVIIMLSPLLGAVLLAFTQSDLGHRALKKRLDGIINQTKNIIPQNQEIADQLEQENTAIMGLARYIRISGCYGVYKDTQVTYFPSGEAKFAELLKQLEEAKHFIFLEYFIIDEGLMWGKVLEILARKAKEGVEVRVLYDGSCEFFTLPHSYPKKLAELGIKCKMFAPFSPVLSTHYNYRDHRKILVIDGHTAFNGGVNLADEYINHIERFGHWKDTAVMLKGEAVKSFTLMFLQMWNITEKETEFENFLHYPTYAPKDQAGFVLPYGDCPLDGEKVGEMVYIDILNRAQRYVHIMTPYLILDGELETALRFAAKRGVEVALILPGIPDKTLPYALAKTQYKSLLEAGVQIYEYTPGFVHAKMFICDDQEAVVGTINLDYRSLYHHFECATYMYQVPCIKEIEEDFQATKALCREVNIHNIWQGHKFLRLIGPVAKTVSPLL